MILMKLGKYVRIEYLSSLTSVFVYEQDSSRGKSRVRQNMLKMATPSTNKREQQESKYI